MPEHTNLCTCGEIFPVESLISLLDKEVSAKLKESAPPKKEKAAAEEELQKNIYGTYTHLHFPQGTKILPQLWYFSKVTDLEIPNSVEALEEQKYSNAHAFFNPPTHALGHTAWLQAQKEDFVVIGDGLCVAYQGECGDVLEIPPVVKHISAGVFRRQQMKKIILPENLKSIGAQAFQNCGALEEITLPEGLLHLGNLAFDDCSSLNNGLNIPQSLCYLGALNPISDETLQKSYQHHEDACYVGDGILMSHQGKGQVELSEKIKFIYRLSSEEITKLTIPSSVQGFRDAVGGDTISLPNLTELTLPKNLIKSGKLAFADCPSLKK